MITWNFHSGVSMLSNVFPMQYTNKLLVISVNSFFAFLTTLDLIIWESWWLIFILTDISISNPTRSKFSAYNSFLLFITSFLKWVTTSTPRLVCNSNWHSVFFVYLKITYSKYVIVFIINRLVPLVEKNTIKIFTLFCWPDCVL